MTDAIREANNCFWFDFEERITPNTATSQNAKWSFTAYALHNGLEAATYLVAGLATGSLVMGLKVYEFVTSFFTKQKKAEGFSTVLNDSREWKKLGDIQQDLEKNPLGANDPLFLHGVATCTYQDSGETNCPDSQWRVYEKQHISEDNRSGQSGNLFQLYRTAPNEVTRRLHQLGSNAYRFSIEWSQIEPNQGEFRSEVLEQYIKFCKHLRDEGIQPMVTLHHFSEPVWFHELGSFEKEENIKHFTNFCEKVVPKLAQDYKGKLLVEYFCTINEPGIEAFSRYIFGSFSPKLHFQWTKAGEFLKGALKAHTVVYDKLKTMVPPSVKLGIVHQYLHFLPDAPLTRYFNRLVNDVAMNFFKTGKIELKVPFACNIVEEMEKPKTDFVGVQAYVRPSFFPPDILRSMLYGEPMTLMPFREDPASIYEAITKCHEAFQAPVIVTENGISTNDNEQRRRYMTRALYAAREAAKVIGEDNLKGYLAWSFTDNFEWDRGMNPQRFGAYALEEQSDGTHKIAENPKPGMDTYVKIVEAWKNLWKNSEKAVA
jgi:beta-glucosidase